MMICNVYTARVECGGCCHYQRPPTSCRLLLVLATARNRREESNAPLSGKPCPLYADISRRRHRQDCRWENVERVRLILLMILSVPLPPNIPPTYWNMSTSSKGSPSSRTAWRCLPRMCDDISLIFYEKGPFGISILTWVCMCWPWLSENVHENLIAMAIKWS